MAATKGERVSFGQRSAEGMASAIGSWKFLIIQSVFLAIWLVWNTWAIFSFWQFDKPPYQGLNLLLSFQAAFTGPILLIAANFGAMRDRAQAARVEHLTEQNEQQTERIDTLVEGMAKLLEADHVEHGRLLRDLHSHTVCTGHTVIASEEQNPQGTRTRRKEGERGQ